MKRFIAVLMLAAVLPVWAASISFEDNTVSVTSEASMYVEPEVATVDFYLKVTSSDPQHITGKARNAAEELYADLKRTGVTEPLVQGSAMDIYTDVDWNTQRPSYQLTLSLRCVVDDLGDLDKVIEKITDQDFSSPDVSSALSMITYSVRDIETYREQLVDLALENAGAKAQAAAAELGRGIGDMVYFDGGEPLSDYMWYPYYPWQYSTQDMGRGDAPRIMIGFSVSATYELTE